MAEYPLDPQLAKMVVASPEFRFAFGVRACVRALRARRDAAEARPRSRTLAHANEEGPPWRGASRAPHRLDSASVRHSLSRMVFTLK